MRPEERLCFLPEYSSKVLVVFNKCTLDRLVCIQTYRYLILIIFRTGLLEQLLEQMD